MSICPLEVLIVITAPKRAIVHQLQSDVNWHAVMFDYYIPVFVYVVKNSLSGISISFNVYIVAQHAL